MGRSIPQDLAYIVLNRLLCHESEKHFHLVVAFSRLYNMPCVPSRAYADATG